MSKIFVTGGNGFVATQILIAALKAGYTVVAQVRSDKRADETKQSISRYLSTDQLSKLSFVIVPKIEADGAFDQVLKDNEFVAVLHTATPFHYNFGSPYELLDPAIGSTKGILNSIKQHAPSVKRVIITSSFASVVDNTQDPRSGYTYSEKDWNPISWEATTGDDKGATYFGAKTFAEKAAWDFVEKEKPSFEVVSLNPPYVYGPVANYVENSRQLSTSAAILYDGYLHGKGKDTEIPAQNIYLWTDVRDLAQAHVKAIDAPDAGNKRFLIANGTPYYHKQISDIFRARYPEFDSQIPSKLAEGLDKDGVPVGGTYTLDNSLSRKILGLQYTPLEDTLVDFAESVKDLK